MDWIVGQEDVPDVPATLGGKGARLWSLLRDGFPVPPACFLTSRAYHLWVEAGKPDDLAAPLLEELQIALDRLLALTDETASFAVRSSALEEDSPDASFAGQLTTCLNVAAGQVPQAVVSVWRSSDAASVVAYRDRMGLAHGDVAVVVQLMVVPEVSGVVFTADPLTGDTARLVINAGWGLGEGVVGGLMEPDQWVVDRVSGRVLESRTGEKGQMVVAATGGGTEVVPTPVERAGLPTLAPSQVADLSGLALRVEAQFGAPQDIEWAYGKGRFWLLQSRPITSRPEEEWVSEFDSETDPDTVWTASNIQEVLPGLLTPLDWSLLRDRLNYASRKPFLDTHTLLDPATEFVALFYGRAFANLSALRGVASRAIGTSPEAIDEQYLGKARDPNGPRNRPSARQLLAYLDTTPRIIRFIYRTSKAVPAAESRLRPWLERVRLEDLSGLTTDELLTRVHLTNAECRDMGALHISTTSGASIYFESLGQLLRRWVGPEGAEVQARLITGLNNIVSAAPGLELSELASLAARDPEVREAVSSPDPWPRIQALTSECATEFRARLALFMSHYGHRSVGELALAAPAWEEEPNTVLSLLRNFLHRTVEAEPQTVAARQQAQRIAATRKVEGRLDPIRRRVFRFVLRQAQSYVSFREQTKSLWMELNHYMRRLFREVGRRLREEGLLADAQDLYFLTFDEVERLSRVGPEDLDLGTLVRRRRAEYARNQGVKLPESFQGRPKPLLQEIPASTSTVLNGIPVSPGVVTGPARVILDPREKAEVLPGEVLVAPVTDVGWTPLFLLVAGLVVDVGGPLSHGSIVAREYGLPAVVNVKTATRMVRTGQTITVNGSTGEVFLE